MIVSKKRSPKTVRRKTSSRTKSSATKLLLPAAKPTAQDKKKDEARRRACRPFLKLPHEAEDWRRQVTYTLTEKLGQGATAQVYRAYNDEGEEFAVKVVPKYRIILMKKQRFDAEVKLHQRLSHPGIVRFRRCFEDDDYVYIVMELCANKSLAHLVRDPMSERLVRTNMKAIVQAVDYLHRRNIVHRDLKLGNIMVDKDLKPKVGDFGLAAVVRENKRTSVCGTPHFVAPEVKTRKGYDQAADIWSIGAIAYKLLFGRYHDDISSLWIGSEKVDFAQVKDVALPTHIAISDEAKDFLASTLAISPASRPTAQQLLEHRFLVVSKRTTKEK
ncbi:kinase-like domain-containing protein [Radiomyces spectabilis]|uniref:kinase-like domain-containing protein n=1 Tax=Radiomyces spectabilis TaxID=64574 RepID=UPI002220AFF6|nr:kinase-like domain-containing protein [Radiomyces spectabilis]KAI8376275.1 kinase-like domain-containing protein [Radiomyces spectabilis]